MPKKTIRVDFSDMKAFDLAQDVLELMSMQGMVQGEMASDDLDRAIDEALDELLEMDPDLHNRVLSTYIRARLKEYVKEDNA